MKKLLTALFVLITCFSMAYTAWNPQNTGIEQKYKELYDTLKSLYELGVKYNTASPEYLSDLKNLLDNFDYSKFTVIPQTPETIYPERGNYVYFNSTNYVEIKNHPSYKTNTLTFECWLKADTLFSWMSPAGFAQDNGGSESGFYFSYLDDKIRFLLRTTKMSSDEWNSNPGASIAAGTWYHIAGTYDGSKICFYLNGKLADSKTVSGDINWQFNPLGLYIGKYYDDNEEIFYKGQVGEVRLWNYARSESEIASSMNKSLMGNEKGLLGYWRLTAPDINVQDLSPLKNNGKLLKK